MSTEREQVAYELAREFPGQWQSLPGCIKDELVDARLKLAAADRAIEAAKNACFLAEQSSSFELISDGMAALRSALLEYQNTKV